MGTLRFDLNTLATAKTGKEEKKAALALSKEFLAAVRRRAGGGEGSRRGLPGSLGSSESTEPRSCGQALNPCALAKPSPPFHHQVEDLDLSLRKKDKDSALSKLKVAQAKLDSALAKVL